MDFSVDSCKLREAEILYKESIDILENARISINNSLKELREDSWEGKAKDSFLDVVYLDWEKGLKEHIKKIEFLRCIVSKAADKVESLENQGEAFGDRL